LRALPTCADAESAEFIVEGVQRPTTRQFAQTSRRDGKPLRSARSAGPGRAARS